MRYAIKMFGTYFTFFRWHIGNGIKICSISYYVFFYYFFEKNIVIYQEQIFKAGFIGNDEIRILVILVDLITLVSVTGIKV